VINVGAEYETRSIAADDNWSLTQGAGTGALTSGAVAREPRSLRSGSLWAKVTGLPAAPAVLAAPAAAALVLLPVVSHATAVRAPALSATLETSMTFLALGGAWLMRTRFADSRRLCDLLAMTGVATLGLMNLCENVLPAGGVLHAAPSSAAAQLWGQVLVGAIFAAAAFAPSGRLITRRRRVVAVAVGLPVAGVAAATLAGLLVSVQVIGATGHITTAAAPLGHPLGLLLSLAAIGLLGSAAVRLTSGESHGGSDRTIPTLGGAVLLLAAAGMYQLVIGPLPAGEVSPGQLPRVFAFVLVLLAAACHEPQARARVAKAAALAERRRVARDLHDGLAQDLAFIAAYGPAMCEEMGDGHPLVIAARRALAVSRSTINELSDPAGATVGESLEAVAQELRDQFDLAIAVDVRLHGDLEPRAKEHVTRITREAIANAARHGGARSVSVSLRRLELAVVLRVVDDGCGLEAAQGTEVLEGFGLASMRERAAALGGCLSLHQPRHGGTELEVVFR
jgi:signal transduction histidine kinase